MRSSKLTDAQTEGCERLKLPPGAASYSLMLWERSPEFIGIADSWKATLVPNAAALSLVGAMNMAMRDTP